jgi:hypothetical protein
MRTHAPRVSTVHADVGRAARPRVPLTISRSLMPPSSKIRRPVVVDLPASTCPQITIETCFLPCDIVRGGAGRVGGGVAQGSRSGGGSSSPACRPRPPASPRARKGFEQPFLFPVSHFSYRVWSLTVSLARRPLTEGPPGPFSKAPLSPLTGSWAPAAAPSHLSAGRKPAEIRSCGVLRCQCGKMTPRRGRRGIPSPSRVDFDRRAARATPVRLTRSMARGQGKGRPALETQASAPKLAQASPS